MMLKVAFNNFVESSTNRMQHVAELPQWNTALTGNANELRVIPSSRDSFSVIKFIKFKINQHKINDNG